jgi:hypothetical protein
MVFLNLVGPVAGIQFRTLVELIMPNQLVTLGCIVSSLG